MKILFLMLFFLNVLLSNDFSQKKILSIKANEDPFEIIDLKQNNPINLDKQEALFNSSNINKEKQNNPKDVKTDFAILVGFKPHFGLALNQIYIKADQFSSLFMKNFFLNSQLHFINSKANEIYQNKKYLDLFSIDNKFHILNISNFLNYEKDKNKIYSQITDFLIVINLNEFYINTTNFFITKTKSANALINFKIIDVITGKIISSKKIKLKLSLDSYNEEQSYKLILDQMPKMLAEIIDKEDFKK